MIRKLLSILIIVISYLIVINIISNINLNEIFKTSMENSTTSESGIQKIGFSDAVSIEVTRKRFYGTILENGNRKNLYLMNVIPITLYAYGINYIWVHVVFVMVLSIWIFLATIKTKRRYYY